MGEAHANSSRKQGRHACALRFSRVSAWSWLRGRRLKGKRKGVLGARGAPLAFLSHLKLPFPSLSNACHAGYTWRYTSPDLSDLKLFLRIPTRPTSVEQYAYFQTGRHAILFAGSLGWFPRWLIKLSIKLLMTRLNWSRWRWCLSSDYLHPIQSSFSVENWLVNSQTECRKRPLLQVMFF